MVGSLVDCGAALLSFLFVNCLSLHHASVHSSLLMSASDGLRIEHVERSIAGRGGDRPSCPADCSDVFCGGNGYFLDGNKEIPGKRRKAHE
jgi:hypothetical protein